MSALCGATKRKISLRGQLLKASSIIWEEAFRQNEVNSSDLKMRTVLGYLRAINMEQAEGWMK